MAVGYCDVRHNIPQERGLLRFGEETERHRPPSANLAFATQSLSTRAITSQQHCAVLANPILLDREPAGGELRTLRSTALPVLILERMPRCASCLV